MIADLYADAALYDLLFPAEAHSAFYCEETRRHGGSALELGCGTAQLLVPVALAGLNCSGLDLSEQMLAQAHRRAATENVSISFVRADMRSFELGERFSSIFVARNSLLHLHDDGDFAACFECVRRHLTPNGVFIFDIFNPSIDALARPPELRVRVAQIEHPERGRVTVESTCDYDEASQVNRATWYFSSAGDPDYMQLALDLHCVFPQELPQMLAANGFELEARYGDLDRSSFESASARQICICRAS